ncbi:MAG: hypothetical protein R3E11_12440 [Sphingobium sp.]
MSKWQSALAVYEIAEEAETSYERDVWTPSYDVAVNGGPNIPDHVDAEIERLASIRCDAEEQLITTSAPNLSAVIWKIEYARKRWKDFEDWPDAWWAAVLGDLRHLAA